MMIIDIRLGIKVLSNTRYYYSMDYIYEQNLYTSESVMI